MPRGLEGVQAVNTGRAGKGIWKINNPRKGWRKKDDMSPRRKEPSIIPLERNATPQPGLQPTGDAPPPRQPQETIDSAEESN